MVQEQGAPQPAGAAVSRRVTRALAASQRAAQAEQEIEGSALTGTNAQVPNASPTTGTTPDASAATQAPIASPRPLPWEQRHLRMAALRPPRKRIHPRLVSAFMAASERSASRYLANSQDENALLDVLALVKEGLRTNDNESTTARLAAYPEVTMLEVQEMEHPPPMASASTLDLAAKVHQSIVGGSLSQAARTLASSDRPLVVTDEVKKVLESKHPVGPANPFPGPGPVGPRTLCKDDEWDGHIRWAMSTIPKDTSGGLSGWSKPLLTLALKGCEFREFIKLLCHQLANGTAPGKTTLGASLLVPLPKKDGGVRPIAVCELIYRLCAKIILRCIGVGDALLPYQFGVGTSGGTEPIIRLGEHFADGTLKHFTCVMATDFSNAYNEADRKGIGDGIRKCAKQLYRMAAWRLGGTTPLIMVQKGTVTTLQSSQGVPQGDPLSPLWFSIGARSVAEKVQNFLGADGFLVCYLDDWYIFGKTQTVVENTVEYMTELERKGESGGLRLNKEKCRMVRQEELESGGFEILGSVVGASAARKAFLQAKIKEQEATINKLRTLPRQDALLLLLLCLQHNLRHLLRCLKTDDIEDAWYTHDYHLSSALRAIRSDVPSRGTFDHLLFPLPLRRGGCGLPTFSALSPCARGAMTDTADEQLRRIFAAIEGVGEQEPLPLEDGQRNEERQRERYRRVTDGIEAQLWARLEQEKDWERAKTVIGSGSLLGWKWMVIAPYDQSTTLSNNAVMVGLWNRSLCSLAATTCKDCGELAVHGHDDVCRPRRHRRTKRHDHIRNVLAATLRRAKDTSVVIEPRLEDRASQHRSDMRVTGPAAPHGGLVEYDLTCISIHSKDAQLKHKHREVKTALEDHGLRAAAKTAIGLQMDAKGEQKRKKYGGVITLAFQPLVITLDGMVAQETAATFKHWRSMCPSCCPSFLPPPPTQSNTWLSWRTHPLGTTTLNQLARLPQAAAQGNRHHALPSRGTAILRVYCWSVLRGIRRSSASHTAVRKIHRLARQASLDPIQAPPRCRHSTAVSRALFKDHRAALYSVVVT